MNKLMSSLPINFYLDSRELSRESRNLIFRLIKSLIFGTVLVWKHFNFLAHPHMFLIVIMYVELTFTKITNIFLAHPMGHIFVEDAIKILE